MNRRLLLVPALCAALVAAFVLGSVGTSTASGITAHAVKKIAAKVVKAKAKKLSVRHAATADSATTVSGLPAPALENRVLVWDVNVTSPGTSNITIPLAPGNYLVGWSVFMGNGGAGHSGCVLRDRGTSSAFFTADDESTDGAAAPGAHSATGFLAVAAGDVVTLHCFNPTAWTATGQEPLQVTAVPMASVTAATFAASRGTASSRSR
jgi:hypothetical protein